MATAALFEPVDEREAPARERLAASLLGEHAVVDAVEFNEPVAERDQGAGVQRPVAVVPSAQREAVPGEGLRVGGGVGGRANGSHRLRVDHHPVVRGDARRVPGQQDVDGSVGRPWMEWW